MLKFRISKYNPALRDELGRYMIDEWTDVGCIGHTYGGHTLTLEEYLSVEAEYVSVVMQFMRLVGVKKLFIADLVFWKYDSLHPELKKECDVTMKHVANNIVIDEDMVPAIVRANQRNCFGCRLLGDNLFFVEFGWDYYMYLGFKNDDYDISKISTSLYIEPFKSPY